MSIDLSQVATVAVLTGLLAPLIIVGTGVVLGLTLSITKVMLGLVLGMIELFTSNDEEDY